MRRVTFSFLERGRRICLVPFFCLAIALQNVGGQPLAAKPEPKSPPASLASIHLPPGFKMELVASEPLIQSPVAFEWGADGKLWVVEMRDYPSGGVAGAICYLEDTKGDGIYDKSTVFLDGLSFPNGLYPWRNGVLVSAAPDIFSAADTTGSGKADLRRTVLTGFFPGNPQHRVSGRSRPVSRNAQYHQWQRCPAAPHARPTHRASSRAQTSRHMKRLDLILNGKGGVGKSFFAVNFVQFLNDRGIAHVAIDSDNENSTSARRVKDRPS